MLPEHRVNRVSLLGIFQWQKWIQFVKVEWVQFASQKMGQSGEVPSGLWFECQYNSTCMVMFKALYNKAHIQNIHALNSDTHTLTIQYEYTQKQCVGVAIEGMDIWYMGLIFLRSL